MYLKCVVFFLFNVQFQSHLAGVTIGLVFVGVVNRDIYAFLSIKKSLVISSICVIVCLVQTNIEIVK